MRKPTYKSDWKDGFLFVGNQLTLDFLNTRPIQNGEPSELIPDFSALLRWFRAADLLSSKDVRAFQRQWGGTARARKTAEAMRELREKLREEILAWERSGSVEHSMLDELNKLMAERPILMRLEVKGKSCWTTQSFELREPEDLFAPLAHSAATLFTKVDRKRVRKCARCVLHFHDTSKKGMRRWCSMQLCGNRLKVAAYSVRRRRRHHLTAPSQSSPA
jgi:predicted RNA-binding Zn ribbon-like protein